MEDFSRYRCKLIVGFNAVSGSAGKGAWLGRIPSMLSAQRFSGPLRPARQS